MAEISKFESRTGRLVCKPEEVFRFVTDIRNFSQFVRDGIVDDLKIESDSCSFRVSPIGNVSLNISEKTPNSKVIYNGLALISNYFSLMLDIRENKEGRAEVTVTLNAEMNPVLKMMAAKPVMQFLETLVDEMEKFRGWPDLKA